MKLWANLKHRRDMERGIALLVPVLLVVAIWRIEAVGDTIEKGSGQVVRTDAVETERWQDESIDHWRERHMAAVREFDQ